MALFGAKKKIETEGRAQEVKRTRTLAVTSGVMPKNKSASTGDIGMSIRVIRQPRITEKATALAEQSNVYVFEIDDRATKRAVREEVRALYKVEPTKVRVARNPSKQLFVRGKRGRRPGVKKAYVYLKAGEKIELV